MQAWVLCAVMTVGRDSLENEDRDVVGGVGQVVVMVMLRLYRAVYTVYNQDSLPGLALTLDLGIFCPQY